MSHASGARRPPLAYLTAAALLVLIAAGCRPPGYRWPELPRHTEGAAHFIVFNIGQADAMLVLHRGRSMLVDAGATWTKQGRENFRNIGRRLEALTGSRRLDYLVVSHYHQDHIGLHGTGPRASVGDLGLWGLLYDEGVTVDVLVDRGSMVLGEKGPTQKNYERGVLKWMRKGLVQRRLKVERHDMLDMGAGLDVEVVAVNGAGRLMSIHNAKPRLLRNFPPSENDYSIVLKFTKGDFELSTGGDLSGEDLTRAFGPNRLSYNDIESVIAGDIGDIEVYRVHHHGSGHSSNDCFMKVLHPEVSIFSTGMNSYGHPSMRVYKTLKRMGKVYITGGADMEVYNKVKDRVLEDDVEVLVAPDGEHYWVNGERFDALSEKEEKARDDRVAECQVDQRERSATEPDETGPLEED